MTEDKEPTGGRKHRVIHWNPNSGARREQRRWTIGRIVRWTLGGALALLFAAGIVIRIVKLVLGPDVFSRPTAVASAQTTDPNAVFVSQSRAELAHDQASQALAEIQKIPDKHPTQLAQLVLLTKSMMAGEDYLANKQYSRALTQFQDLNQQIDAFNRSVQARQQAKDGFNTLMQQIRDLEIARSLDPATLDAATTSAAEVNRLLNDGSFLAAKRALDDGTAQVASLQKTLTDYIANNLLQGQQALTRGQKEEATKDFNAALKMSPGNEDAMQGLKRAENIDRVYALLVQGANLEKETRYAEAADSYGKAFELDPLSAAAQEGKFRAARLEKDTRFNSAYSAAQAAFQRRDWDTAVAQAQKALEVYPARSEVRDMIANAKDNAHKDAVQKALDKGVAAEKANQWQDARDAYQEVLNLEPDQQDAKDGFERAGVIIRALIEYNSLIDQSQQLTSEGEFQTAIGYYNQAMGKKPSYLPYSEEVVKLHTELQRQSVPVSVTFTSDGRTYVQISGVLAPARFDQRTMSIKPGNYSVRGTRKGYQDVVMTLQVRAGTTFAPISVVCSTRADRS